MDGSRGDRVAGTQPDVVDRSVGEPEPAVDDGGTPDEPSLTAVAILDVGTGRGHRPQQRTAFDGDLRPRQPDARVREVAAARQFVAGNVVLGDEHRSRSEFLGDRHTDRPADRIEHDHITVGWQLDHTLADLGDVEHRHRVVIDVVGGESAP